MHLRPLVVVWVVTLPPITRMATSFRGGSPLLYKRIRQDAPFAELARYDLSEECDVLGLPNLGDLSSRGLRKLRTSKVRTTRMKTGSATFFKECVCRLLYFLVWECRLEEPAVGCHPPGDIHVSRAL
ncbi:hypothetical protein F4861DRAFT_280228 [Xylaria intraflava]|nr:hypothetical protein F4861DRAFT_280228 [Xylaria intraflava]